jgi:hypothetical protein
MVSPLFLHLRMEIPGLRTEGAFSAANELSVAIVLGAVRSTLWSH